MKTLFPLVAIALLAACGNNVVSSNASNSSGSSGSTTGATTTGGSTSSTTTGSSSTGSGATTGSDNGTTSGTTTGTTGANLVRPNYPSGPYSVDIGGIVNNYALQGYLAPSSGVQIDSVASFGSFDLQAIRNITQSNGTPYRYLLLNLSAGWCPPCNAEADDFGLQGADSAKPGQWLAKGGLYATVMVQAYSETSPTSPAQSDVDYWLGDHKVQSNMAGDLDGYLISAIPQTEFPANLVVNLDTMEIEDAWYGNVPDKITNSWEAKLNQ